MLDFASSLYLGLRHPRAALGSWEALTTGTPAAFAEPPLARALARRAAALQGSEAGVVGPSTLHLFWDVLGFLARRPLLLLADEQLYPIGKCGVERAQGKGATVRWFPHGQPFAALAQLRERSAGRRIVLVTDAVSAAGTAVDLRRYLAATPGMVVVDNTQALGLFGANAGPSHPFGLGGGGIIPHAGTADGNRVIVIASLAKAFGAPLATLSASRKFVAEFAAASETRVHCSPPSAAALLAASRALHANAHVGEGLRRQLLANVHRLSLGLRRLGLGARESLFPLQRIHLPAGCPADGVHRHLQDRGVRAVVLQGRAAGPPQLAAIVRADHSADDIDTLLASLGAARSAVPRLCCPAMAA